MISLDFLTRFAILNFGCIVLLRGLYFRSTPNREAVFSFYLFANSIFVVTYLLGTIEISMGFAFGLFAVFAMLRYRTEEISMRDMTFLFVVIGLALITAVSRLGPINIIAIHLLFIVLAWCGESTLFTPRIYQQKIIFDDIELIKLQNRAALIKELSERTGQTILDVKVDKIDFLTDSAQLTLFTKISDL